MDIREVSLGKFCGVAFPMKGLLNSALSVPILFTGSLSRKPSSPIIEMFPPVAVWIVLAVVVIINLVFKTIDRICAALKQTKLEATLDKHTEQP